MSTLVQEILQIGTGARRLERKKFSPTLDSSSETEPHNRCVHELFELQVERTPDAIAIVAGSERLSYCELNERANQVARFLKRFGVGPNSLVGVCLERTPELLIGVLGILKAGAAYVPLDPMNASKHLTTIIKDANVFVLLTQASLAGVIPRHDGPKLLLDSGWDIITKEKKTNPARRATTKNLAYVIYTSGSGTESKGVMISHRGLLNYLSWGVEAYEVAKNSSGMIDPSISFDLAITRLLSLLMLGRDVVLDANACAATVVQPNI